MAVDYTKANLVYGTSGNDRIDAQAGNDTVYGHAGNDLLRGGTGNDFLYGEAGNDTLDGGDGNDYFNGGDGSDTVLYTVNTSALLVDLALGRVSFPGHAWPAETLVSIENIDTGSGNDTVTGSSAANLIHSFAGDDSLIGGAGNDTLDGGAGSDHLDGGSGNDVYYVDTGPYTLWNGTRYVDLPGDVIVESLAGSAGGTDSVFASVNWTLGSNFENLTLTGYADHGTGNALANLIQGGAQDDTLDGLAGNDTLAGGAGNDTLLDGDGTDRFDGGSGLDTVVYSRNTAAIAADLALGRVTFPGHTWPAETLISIENIQTGSGNDTVTGSSGANRIETNDGADLINGGLGNDTLVGGMGNDTLNGDDGNDILAGGRYGQIDQFVSGDDGAPNPVNYTPYNDGADLINGGSGSDTVTYSRETLYEFSGGFGSWEYLDKNIYSDLQAGYVRLPGTGFEEDKLISIENIETGNGNDTVYGSSAANIINTHDGVNLVFGRGGNDTIYGGGGADAKDGDVTYTSDGNVYFYNLNLSSGDALDDLSGGDGNDTIISNGSIVHTGDNRGYFDDFVWAHDRLSGGNGSDRLVAGFGFMEMAGGAGSDRFEFSTEAWGHWTYMGTDSIRGQQATIEDFSRSDGDKIVIKQDHTAPMDWYVPEGKSLAFVGTAADDDFFKLHYHHSTGADGQTDTVIEMLVGRLGGWEGGPEQSDAVLTITLAGYSGDLQAGDFVFA